MVNRIKELRKARGLTQEELGKRLNVQKAAISKYENGTVTPNGEVLKRLSAIFNVTTDYLLGCEISNSSLTSIQKKLLESFDMLNVEGQNLIIGMLSSLKLSHAKENGKISVVQRNLGGINNLAVNGNIYNK